MKLAAGCLAPLVLIAPMGTAPASPASTESASSSPAQNELRARTADFSKAIVEASGKGWSPDSVARIADFYAVDAVVFPPRGEPLRGRQAQVTFWSSRERHFLTHTATPERIDVSGDLATEWGTLIMKTKQGAAAAVEGKASYISVWTRRDGVWRKQMDTWW